MGSFPGSIPVSVSVFPGQVRDPPRPWTGHKEVTEMNEKLLFTFQKIIYTSACSYSKFIIYRKFILKRVREKRSIIGLMVSIKHLLILSSVTAVKDERPKISGQIFFLSWFIIQSSKPSYYKICPLNKQKKPKTQPFQTLLTIPNKQILTE